MNELDYSPVGHMTYAELEGRKKRAAKQLRKLARKFIRSDLQRRAITGEPSPFRREVPEAHQ